MNCQNQKKLGQDCINSYMKSLYRGYRCKMTSCKEGGGEDWGRRRIWFCRMFREEQMTVLMNTNMDKLTMKIQQSEDWMQQNIA